jgi:hypothetical protein
MPKEGDKIVITDKKLPNYGKTYTIMFKVPNTEDLWSYGGEENIKLGIAESYAGSSQFEIKNADIV